MEKGSRNDLQQSPILEMSERLWRCSYVLSMMCRMVGIATSWNTGTARNTSASLMKSVK